MLSDVILLVEPKVMVWLFSINDGVLSLELSIAYAWMVVVPSDAIFISPCRVVHFFVVPFDNTN